MDGKELDEKMSALLETMKEAVFDDQSNIKDKKPAYSKMKLLPVVHEQLAK